MRLPVLRLALVAGLVLPAHAALAGVAPAATPAPSGIARLIAGNERFVKAGATHPHQDAARRHDIASAQSPFAVVVSCSDSRVPPELVFDQGLGDVFVVRTAGQVVDSVALGSIEFAVAKLGARSILVLGHERCGAVQAALEHAAVPGSIGAILAAIQPIVGGPEKATPDALDRAIRKNARAVAKQLRLTSPVLAPMIAKGSLEVGAAVYDLDSGAVSLSTGADAR